MQIRRPRARTLDAKELPLPSWTTFGAEDPLAERAVEQGLVGVTTRRYARSLEPLPADLPSRGTSKSAVSRRFVAATERQMTEWLGRDLSALDLGVLMLDGVHIDKHVMLVALGIDADGNKHVLGVREGATENAAACTALLADLRDRCLPTDRPTLVVVDGSKALAKAARNVVGERAIIQRCQIYKIRNVVDQLPDEMKPSVRQAMRDAYAASDVDRAHKRLTNLVRRLEKDHPGAAASLEEGLDETLSVKRLRLPKTARTSALDDECDRERHGRCPSTLTSSEALARRQSDLAVDRRRCRRRRAAIPQDHRGARGDDSADARARSARNFGRRGTTREGRVMIAQAFPAISLLLIQALRPVTG